MTENYQEALNSVSEREMTPDDVENLIPYFFEAILKACGDKVIPVKNLANRTTPVSMCRMLAEQVRDILNQNEDAKNHSKNKRTKEI